MATNVWPGLPFSPPVTCTFSFLSTELTLIAMTSLNFWSFSFSFSASTFSCSSLSFISFFSSSMWS